MSKQMTDFDKVEEFHTAFNLDVDGEWSADLLYLRMSLIREEFDEVIEEVSNCVTDFLDDGSVAGYQKAALTKELCDLLYVVHGTAVALGLPLEPAFNRVHSSNMSKLGEDGKPVYRDDGKVLKGPNYKQADLLDLFD